MLLPTRRTLALMSCLTVSVLSNAPTVHAKSGDLWALEDAVEGGGADASTPYSAGQRALDAGEYDKAIASFKTAADQNPSQADAALYWLAYAHNKAGHKAETLAALQQLRERFPKSRWIDDAKALEIEVRGDAGAARAEAATSDDEEIKLYALQSLLNANPERAVPTVERFLSKPHSQKLEEQALFVLSQADSPTAKQLLAQIALGNQYPQLRKKAIESLGVAGDNESRRLLGDVYTQSKDVEVKKKVLEAFMVSGDKARVFQAATGETSPELRAKAIEMLGVMDATAELKQLYQRETATELRRKIIESFMVASDADALLEITRTERDPELLRHAVQNLGLVGGAKSHAALKDIYRGSNDVKVKTAVLEAFFIGDDPKDLIEVAKGESNRELRREALKRLSQMDSPEALDFLSKQLDN
jgi:outer membrane protein assembly factor BamD (BamD/ComL family)